MRYILDDRGYVKYCSNTYITCENKTCTPYEGTIPDGYETIEEWVQNANIRAYKIEDGNLVFDRAEDSKTRREYEELAKTYSETEKIIGTWINGKPLYQKVLKITTNIDTEYNQFPHNIANVDMIFIKNAFVVQTVGDYAGWSYPLPIGLYNSNTDEDKLSVVVSGWGVRFFVQTHWSESWEKYVILNYTKTTD